MELTNSANQRNFCPAETSDTEEFSNGEVVYLAGCASGDAKVELRTASTNDLIRSYTFRIQGATPPGQVSGLTFTSTSSSITARWETESGATS